VIGWGTERSRLQSWAKERGLEPWVRFTGPLYGDALWTYIATGPATSSNDKLNIIKIFEYTAFGLPMFLFDLAEGRTSAGDQPFEAALQLGRTEGTPTSKHVKSNPNSHL
jgi:hypothetical protein